MPEYKLIVAGSRDFNDYALLTRVLFAMSDVELADKSISIVSGMARGADALGHHFAKQHGIQVYEYPANWNQYGKRAGYVRNEQMGLVSDALIAFWDGKSNGTNHMINFMKSLNKPVTVIKY